jgi:hypothetical protein
LFSLLDEQIAHFAESSAVSNRDRWGGIAPEARPHRVLSRSSPRSSSVIIVAGARCPIDASPVSAHHRPIEHYATDRSQHTVPGIRSILRLTVHAGRR